MVVFSVQACALCPSQGNRSKATMLVETLDNPGLIASCVIGDGETETGSLAVSSHSNTPVCPAIDGVVLPILRLNGWKIANPTVLARIPHKARDGRWPS